MMKTLILALGAVLMAAHCPCPGRNGPQRLQLVRLHRRGHHRQVRGRDRHQGQLRRLRQQRDWSRPSCWPAIPAMTSSCPRAIFLERQIAAGLFLPLDKSKLPNLANMDPDVMATAADPRSGQRPLGRLYDGAPPASATTSPRSPSALGDQPDRHLGHGVQARDRRQARRLRRHHARRPGRGHGHRRSTISASIPTRKAPTTCQRPRTLLMSIRPYVRYFHSSQYIDDLGNGEICLSRRLFGRRLHRRRRGRRGRCRRRGRLRHPQGRRAEVVRPAGHPGRCAASRQRPQVHRLHAASPRSRPPTPTTCSTPSGNKAALELIDPTR